MENKLVRPFEIHAMKRDGDESYNQISTFILNIMVSRKSNQKSNPHRISKDKSVLHAWIFE